MPGQVKITRGSDRDNERYYYDCGPCSLAKGWAQIDTDQDAYYFGAWANPVELKIFTFSEGDTAMAEYPDTSSFAAALRQWLASCSQLGRRYMVDPGRRSLAAAFVQRGAADCIYPEYLTGEED